MSNEKDFNPYELVHLVAEAARLKEEVDRNPIPDKRSNYVLEINKVKEKRNYVLEAFEEVLNPELAEERRKSLEELEEINTINSENKKADSE